MPDQPGTPPPPERASAPAPEPAGGQKHRHLLLVWSLVVLASVVLFVSMIANWVQTEVLDTNQFADSTEEILQNQDVQEQLSIFAVDQLYANADVQAHQSRSCRPPPSRSPFQSRRRRDSSYTMLAETALASPRVQNLVATMIDGAQQRFVSLIENKGQFVSTEGGIVPQYGALSPTAALAWE